MTNYSGSGWFGFLLEGQRPAIGPLLVLSIVNDLPDVLEALLLLFGDGVKMATQNMSLHISQECNLPMQPLRIRGFSAFTPRIWYTSLFAKPRGRYQPLRANSKIG